MLMSDQRKYSRESVAMTYEWAEMCGHFSTPFFDTPSLRENKRHPCFLRTSGPRHYELALCVVFDVPREIAGPKRNICQYEGFPTKPEDEERTSFRMI